MDEHLASVIWDELKRYINAVERVEAAENLVSILVDNDFDPANIKTAFAGDKDIKNALLNYLDEDSEEEEEDYDEEYIDDDDDY